MDIEEVQHNLDEAIKNRKADQANLESKLELKINKLEKQVKQVSDDICGVKEDVKGIADTLAAWQPYIESYEKELDRAKAYQLVANDLKNKGVSWKFWLSLIGIIVALIGGMMAIIEHFAPR